MEPVTVVGLALGGLVVLAVVIVSVQAKTFSNQGLGALLIGFLMIGFSQWGTIVIRGADFELELSALTAALGETQDAVATVADQSVATATVAGTTQSQLLRLTDELSRRQILPTATVNTLQGAVRATPQVDTAAVNAAAERLRLQRLPGFPR